MSLRAFRREQHLTQRELAEKIGWHPVVVCQVETGVATAGERLIMRFAKAYDLTFDAARRILCPQPSRKAKRRRASA
jgi:transcriptional regulator with XRE-family HTH domain